MVDVQTSRMCGEVLGEAPTGAMVARFGMEPVFAQGSAAVAELRTSRLAGEALGDHFRPQATMRFGMEPVFLQASAAVSELRTSRLTAEVIGAPLKENAVHRFGLEGVFSQASAAVAEFRVSRVCGEVLGRLSNVIVRPAFPANIELFNHNWIRGCRIATTFQNNVAYNPESLDEHRLGLGDRPTRVLDFSWSVPNEHIITLMSYLRDVLNENTVVPLLPDSVNLAPVSAGATRVFGDFSRGRWFQNGGVFIVYADFRCRFTAWDTTGIVQRSTTFIDLEDPISDDNPLFAIPAVFVHSSSEAEVQMVPDSQYENHSIVTVSFDEIAGPSALPASASDTPSGYSDFLGYPTLGREPNRVNPFPVNYERLQDRDLIGRGLVVSPQGPRHRMGYELDYSAERRPQLWKIVQLFEACRGRLRPLWFVEPEKPYKVALVSGATVHIIPNGPLAEFTRELTHLGIVHTNEQDAETREVLNVTTIVGAWVVTLTTPFSAHFTADTVCRAGRSRLCRFEGDTLEEEWILPAIGSIRPKIIELLNERTLTA